MKMSFSDIVVDEVMSGKRASIFDMAGATRVLLDIAEKLRAHGVDTYVELIRYQFFVERTKDMTLSKVAFTVVIQAKLGMHNVRKEVKEHFLQDWSIGGVERRAAEMTRLTIDALIEIRDELRISARMLKELKPVAVPA